MNPVVLATATLAAIDAAIEADQGNKYRSLLATTLPAIGDAYETNDNDSPGRSHLGVSGIGDECAKKKWLLFRWCGKEKLSSKMLRLFNRGHLEEGRFIALLLMIGIAVYQQDGEGKQLRVSGHGGHYGSATDGVLIGVPDLPPGVPSVGEFKTHGAKSFAKFFPAKEGQPMPGLRVAHYKHYVQCQTYMTKLGVPYCLYLAVNKDTDELYGEILTCDGTTSQTYEDHAGTIIFGPCPSRMRGATPTYYQCKTCPVRGPCYTSDPLPLNCRTCRHVKPLEDGTWVCTLNGDLRDKAAQQAGCDKWKSVL